MGTAEATPVVPAIPVDAYEHAIALDATASHFAYAATTGVYLADVDGAARKVADSGGVTFELAWTADGKYVAYAELEIPAKCVGNVCSSSSADELYRVKLISVPDGKVTTVKEHVFGFHGLSTAARGNTFAYQGANGNLTLLHPETGTTESLVSSTAFTTFKWSPDGERILCGNPFLGGDAGKQLDVVRLSDMKVTHLAATGADEAVGFPFFWRPDSQAVRLLTVKLDTLIVFDHPVSGEASQRDEFPVVDDNPEGDRGHGPWQATPDGRWLVASRQRDIHTRTALVALDPATHVIQRLGPPADETIFAAASTTFLARSGAYPHFAYYWMKLPAPAQTLTSQQVPGGGSGSARGWCSA